MDIKKIIPIVLLFAVLAIAGFYYFGKTSKVNDQLSQNKLVTDDFEVILPQGWIKSDPAAGVSAMAVNADEQLNNPAAQQINFKSYFAVSRDTIEDGGPNEYMKVIENSLQQIIPGISFREERDMEINGRDARVVETEMTQKGVDFKALVVSIKGDGNDIWTISFSTTKNKWEEYKESFFNVANSFKLKIKE